jgi:hypothetical protein
MLHLPCRPAAYADGQNCYATIALLRFLLSELRHKREAQTRDIAPMTHLNTHCSLGEADVLPYTVQQYQRIDNNFTEKSHSSEVRTSRF